MKMPKQVKLKTFLLTIILISVISLGSILYVSSLTLYPGTITDLWIQSPLFERTYIIGQYNSTFYEERNSITGEIDFLSSDPQYVIESTINHSSIIGGFGHGIFLKNCTYNLPRAIKICHPVQIEGEGWGTILKLNDYANCNVIYFASDTSGVSIKNLAIDGNEAHQSVPSWRDEQSGIYSGIYNGYQMGAKTDNLVLENLYIHSIHSGAAIRLVMSDNILISNVKIYGCGNYGLVYCDGIWVGNSTNVKIEHADIDSCSDVGICLANCEGSTIIDPNLGNCGTYGIGGGGIAIGNEYKDVGTNHSKLSNYNNVIGGYIDSCNPRGLYIFRYDPWVGSNWLTVNCSDHTTISNVQFRNNLDYNFIMDGYHVNLVNCHLGQLLPFPGKKDVLLIYGNLIVSSCTILDAEVGIQATPINESQLTVTSCTFDNLDYALNVTNCRFVQSGNQYFDTSLGEGLLSDPSMAGYIVYSYQGSYYMKNCTTAMVDLVSTDFSSVMNSALGKTPKGSYVYMKGAGYRWLTSTIYVPDQVGLRGEGWGDGSLILASTSDINYVWLSGEASWIENVYFECASTSFSHTILTVNGSFCKVEHVRMVRSSSTKNMGGTGLKVVAGSVLYSTFSQISIQGNFTYGVVLENTLTYPGYYVNQNEFRNIQVGLSDYGYHYGYVLNKTGTGDLIGNTFYSCTTDLGFNGTYIYINNAVSTEFFDFKTWDTFTGATLLNITDSDSTDTRFFGGLLGYSISPNIVDNGLRTRFNNVWALVTEKSGSTSCVNGTWIPHGLSLIPTNIQLTLNNTAYLNSSSSLLQPTVLAVNSTHFQVGFLQENNPINVAKGLVDSGAVWNISMNDLEYATDENYLTRTTVGSTQVNGTSANYGTIMYDLGQVYDDIEIEIKLMFGNDIAAGAYGRVYLEMGDNNTFLFRAGGYHSCVAEEWTANNDWVQYVHAMGRGRYILIGWYATGAYTGVWRGAIYEFKVWDITHRISPVSVPVPLMWTATHQP